MPSPFWTRKVLGELDQERNIVLKQKAAHSLMFKQQLWNHKPHRFFKTPSATEYFFLKRWFKEFGKKLAVAVASSTTHDLSKFINTINTIDRQFNSSLIPDWMTREHVFNQLVKKQSHLSDHLTVCPECEKIRHRNSFEVVNNGNSATNKEVCSSCISLNYKWSEMMGEYIHRYNAIAFYASQREYDADEPDWITHDFACDTDTVYYSDNIEAYILTNVIIHSGNDDDEGGEEDGLYDYHCARRNFIIRQENKNTIYQNMPPLGLELEFYAPDRYVTVHKLQNNFSPVGTLVLERDGSLDPYHGIEAITDPLGYEEWQTMGPALCQAVKHTDCVAYTASHEDYSYGIHITLARCYLSPLQEARMFLFMVAEENKDFIRVIAQRNGIYGARVEIGKTPKIHQNIHTIGGLGYGDGNKKKVLGAGRYTPINFKEHLAEIRIFQATLHEPSFMKNLEFVWALVEWTRSTTGANWYHMDFVKWLGHRNKARKDYPNLYNYLLRPKYRIKNHSYAINNTWLMLLPVPNHNPANEFVVPTMSDDALLAA